MKPKLPRLKSRLSVVAIVGSIVTASCIASTDLLSGPSAAELSAGGYVIDVGMTAEAQPFDRRLLGTNVPAWLRAERLEDPGFRAETIASGTTLLRMPGGSWSNLYDWLGCETDDATNCFATWAARPSDFAGFMRATGLPGMWTASMNETAQSAAAAVAFFNGDVDDDRVIGLDRDGVDWMTVGTWAQLRAENGHPDPVSVEYWEVGNEVYGGKRSAAGDECASFGWEEVWTCDGVEYALGNEDNDGFLDYHRAMTAVDPTIQVGAVGVADPGSWNDWGEEVIREAGDVFDFYVVHHYPFDSSPDVDEALGRAAETWPDLTTDLETSLGADIPVAVTEYNLVSFHTGDTDRSMKTALNALFIADSIGQFATNGVSIANQWNLANGPSDDGTDYGMINLDDGSRRPQFYALSSWARAGGEVLPVVRVGESLHLYPTRHDDGQITLIALNRSDETLRTTLAIEDPDLRASTASIISHGATDVDDQTLRTAPRIDTVVLSDSDGSNVIDVELPPWSISTIETHHDA